MALIKCPECGKQFSEYAAFCPQCGMPIKDVLPLINHQQNHSTLGNASQNVQTYIVHSCPDCGNETIEQFDVCPNCGCPKEHFIRKVKVANNSSVQATYICPDCGNKMDNNQSNCPICGCPKELLTKEKQILQSTDNNNKKNKGPLILIILVVIALISVSIHIFKEKQAEEHRQQQEQYERNAREQERQREREKEEAKREYEQAQKKMIESIKGTWRSETIATNSGYCEMYFFFTSDNRFQLKLYEKFTGSVLESQKGKYSVVPPEKNGKNGGIVLNPNSSNSSWVEYESGNIYDYLTFGDYRFSHTSYSY